MQSSPRDQDNFTNDEPIHNDLGAIKKRFLRDEKKKVDDLLLIITLCLASTYCLAVTIVTGYYVFNTDAYTGGISSPCYANSFSAEPVRAKSSDAVDVTSRFDSLMIVGFAVHFIGFFCDASFAIRVKVENKVYRVASLIAVFVYTVFFAAWLIWLIVLRYRFIGQVCSGDYLSEQL